MNGFAVHIHREGIAIRPRDADRRAGPHVELVEMF